MNRDLPSSDDADLDAGAMDIERRLKALQPRPTTIDVQGVMVAAERLDTQADPSSGDGAAAVGFRPARNAPIPQFKTIAVSSLCGAVTGALLACVALLPVREPPLTTFSPEQQQPNTSLGAAGQTAALDSLATMVDRAGAKQPRWSPSEWYITARMARMLGPLTTDERTLSAETLPNPASLNPGPADRNVGDAAVSRSTASSNQTPEKVSRPNLDRALDRSELLRQLLGDGPALRL